MEGIMVNGVQVKVETVTPLFLGGADPRGALELRAASVRGALRFWLRALLGGVIGDEPQRLQDLRAAEAAVFGSTDTGASPVIVRIVNSPREVSIPFSKLAEWDPKSKRYGKPGIAYLFFAARGTRNEPERYAIQAGTSFDLEIVARPGAKVDNAFEYAYAALWLLTHLGGLGARSRRGAGSLQVTRVEGNTLPSELPPLEVRSNTPVELQEELRDGLRRLREMAGVGTSVGSLSVFDVLHPKACRVWVVDKTFGSWEGALDSIGQQMRQFRNRRPPDYENVKKAVQGGPLTQPVQRAAFGLPIVFYYRSLRGAKGTLEGERHDRRASPLLIRTTRLSNEKYTLVLTFFQAKLLESGENLRLKRQGSPALVAAPDLSPIGDFIKEIRKNLAPCLEVTGW